MENNEKIDISIKRIIQSSTNLDEKKKEKLHSISTKKLRGKNHDSLLIPKIQSTPKIKITNIQQNKPRIDPYTALSSNFEFGISNSSLVNSNYLKHSGILKGIKMQYKEKLQGINCAFKMKGRKIEDIHNFLDEKNQLGNTIDFQLQQLRTKVYSIQYADRTIIQLYEDKENQIELKEDSFSYYKIASKDKSVPLKLKFSGIKDEKINFYLSYYITRPSQEDFSQIINKIENKTIYTIVGNEKFKSRFTNQYIFISLHSDKESNQIKLLISFKFDPTNNQLKAKMRKTINPEQLLSDKSKSFKIADIKTKVDFYLENEPKLLQLYKSVREIKKQKQSKFLLKYNGVSIVEKNINVANSYNEFVLSGRRQRTQNIKRLKQVNIRKQKMEKDLLILKTCRINKWNLIKFKVMFE